MEPNYPQIDEATRLIRQRATAQRELHEAKALIPAYQTVIENAARTTVTALQAGLLPAALVAKLRETLGLASAGENDGH